MCHPIGQYVMPSRVQKMFKAKHIHAKSTTSVIEDEKCIFTDPYFESLNYITIVKY